MEEDRQERTRRGQGGGQFSKGEALSSAQGTPQRKTLEAVRGAGGGARKRSRAWPEVVRCRKRRRDRHGAATVADGPAVSSLATNHWDRDGHGTTPGGGTCGKGDGAG